MSTLQELSLDDLRKQFLELQEEKGVARLTDQNVIELVSYLRSKQFLQTLLFTIDGKEYVTEDQLRREIEQELELSGGRINTVELPAHLNLDYGNIERMVDKMVKEDPSLHLVGNELVNTKYLNNVCQEINELLQESGSIQLSDMTKNLGLPKEFVEKVVIEITARVGKIIKGRLEDETLYTDQFVKREKARIRGAFSALTRPVSVSDVISKFHESLFESLLRELIKEKRINGSLVRGTYIPKIFEVSIEDSIQQFINQNQYIGNDIIGKLTLKDYAKIDRLLYYKQAKNAAKNYIQQKFPNAICLDEYAVTKSLLDTLDGAIENAALSDEPLDILGQSILPPQFSHSDVTKLLKQCPCMSTCADKFVIFGETFIMPKKIIKEVVDSFAEDATKAVKQLYSNPQPAPTIKKETKVEKEDSDDDDEPRRGRGSKKSRRKKKNIKKQSKLEDSDDESNEKSHEDSKIEKILPSADAIWKKTSQLLKDEAPFDQDIIDEIIEHIKPQIKELYIEARNSVFVDASADRMKLHKQNETAILSLIVDIQLHHKAISWFKDTDVKTQLDRYLLKSKCAELVDIIFKDQALHHHLENETDVKAMLKNLPGNISKPLQALKATLQKNMKEFLKELDSTAEQLNIFFRPLDKKHEKQHLTNKKYEILEKLKVQTEPSELIILICTALLLIHQNIYVQAPGKLVSALVSGLQDYVNDEIYELLVDCQSFVSGYIVSQRKKDEAYKDFEVMTTKLEKLRQSVLEDKQGTKTRKK